MELIDIETQGIPEKETPIETPKEMYQEMYGRLFNAATKALRSLQEKQYADAQLILMNAQREAERIFMQWDEPPQGVKNSGMDYPSRCF